MQEDDIGDVVGYVSQCDTFALYHRRTRAAPTRGALSHRHGVSPRRTPRTTADHATSELCARRALLAFASGGCLRGERRCRAQAQHSLEVNALNLNAPALWILSHWLEDDAQ